jgi:hypothetical protein
MAKKQVNFKLPQNLIEALDAKAESENTNRTELVTQGIRYILGLSEVQSDSVDNHVYNRIDSLEARLHQIETHRIDGSADDCRIDQLEDKVRQLESQRIDDDIHNRLHMMTEQIQNLSDCLAQIQGQKEKESTAKVEHHNLPEASTVGDQPTKLTLTELAKRLSIDRSNLSKARKSKTVMEFFEYTQQRDPLRTGWIWNEESSFFTSKTK